MIKIIINDIPPNLSQIIAMCKRGWYIYYHEKQDWTEQVGYLALSEKNKRGGTIKKPVKIVVKFYFKTKRRRDPDNYNACAKFLLDGLVEGGLLKDDSFDEIESVKVARPEHDKEHPRTELVILE